MTETKNKNPKTSKAQAAVVAALGVEIMGQIPDAVTRTVYGDEMADLMQAAFGDGTAANKPAPAAKKPGLPLAKDR